MFLRLGCLVEHIENVGLHRPHYFWTEPRKLLLHLFEKSDVLCTSPGHVLETLVSFASAASAASGALRRWCLDI